MAGHSKRSDEFAQERAKGSGPSWEPAMTHAEWLRESGYCPECHTYHKEDSCTHS